MYRKSFLKEFHTCKKPLCLNCEDLTNGINKPSLKCRRSIEGASGKSYLICTSILKNSFPILVPTWQFCKPGKSTRITAWSRPPPTPPQPTTAANPLLPEISNFRLTPDHQGRWAAWELWISKKRAPNWGDLEAVMRKEFCPPGIQLYHQRSPYSKWVNHWQKLFWID